MSAIGCIDAVRTLLARAEANDQSGHGLMEAGNIAAAAEAWTDTAGAFRTAASELVLGLAETLERAAAVSVQAGSAETGLALAVEAIARLRSAQADGSTPGQRLAARLGSLGQLLCVLRSWDTATEVLMQAASWFGADPDRIAQRQRIQVLDALATAYPFTGRYQDAVAALNEATASSTLMAERGSLEDRLQLAHLNNALGQILLETQQPQAALPVLRQCVEQIEGLAGEAVAPQVRNLQAAACNRLGHVHMALQDRGAAVAYFERSVALMRVLVENGGHVGLADDLQTAMRDLELAR